MDDLMVQFDGVSKKYCQSLKRSMLYGVTDIGWNMLGMSSHPEKLRAGEFWAVDDVSFTIRRGESIGLIGPNGSGKTSLLKLLNGIFWPDRGKITVRGRVGALIAVGAGFHPLLTGRENVYVNGAILGMSKSQVNEQFDRIVEFADIGDFLDTPVKHYSSGMFVRLGFAVAVHCSPDILLVDEVLAVGDRDFQIKCYQKMHEIRKNGTTIILVSHNEYTIRETTERCVYLHHGRKRFEGSSEEAISLYIKDTLEHKSAHQAIEQNGGSAQQSKAEILSLKFFDKDQKEVSFIESGQELNLVMECLIREKLKHPIFGVNFYDNNGFMYCANSDYESVAFGDVPLKRLKIIVRVPEFHLPMNNYLCSAVIADQNPDNLMDWHNMTYRLTVGRAKNSRGSVKLKTQWSVE